MHFWPFKIFGDFYLLTSNSKTKSAILPSKEGPNLKREENKPTLEFKNT